MSGFVPRGAYAYVCVVAYKLYVARGGAWRSHHFSEISFGRWSSTKGTRITAFPPVNERTAPAA